MNRYGSRRIESFLMAPFEETTEVIGRSAMRSQRPIIIAVALFTITVLASTAAEAEPTNPVDHDDPNPLEPLLQKIGADWGVVVDAKRIALNPLRGTVVIRQFGIESQLQGRFLSVPRIAVHVDWDAGQIEQATIEGANLSVDITKLLGLKQHSGEKSLGYFRETTLHSSTVSLKANGIDLVHLKGLTGSASNLGIKSAGKRLAAQGAISLTKGEAHFLDGTTKLTHLKIKGAFEGRQLGIRSLSGKLGGGTVTCQGVIPLDNSKAGTPKSLQCRLNEVRLRRGDFLDVTVNGDVTLTKQSKQYRLSGSLDVVSGTKLQPERWGPRRGKHGPFAVDLTLRLKTKGGRATAKLLGTAQSGRVEIMGRNKRRSARWVEKLLRQLSASPDTSSDVREK